MCRNDSKANELAAISSPIVAFSTWHEVSVCIEGYLGFSITLHLILPCHIDFLKPHCTLQLPPPTHLGRQLSSWHGEPCGLSSGQPLCHVPAMPLQSPSNSSTHRTVEMEMPHSKRLSIFHKLYTSLEIAWNSQSFLSLSYTSMSISPVCFWKSAFTRASGSKSNT